MANNPYVNKVQYGGTTVMDISDTSATADKILQGYGAYGANGAWMNGSLVIQRYYTGSSAPSASLGNDGDIYLQTV